MSITARTLWTALAQPQTLTRLDGEDLSDLIRLAWRQALAPRLGRVAVTAGVIDTLPPLAGRALADLSAEAQRSALKMQFELERIASALRTADFPTVVLKGGAYFAAGYDFGAARMASDVDILVPRDALDAAEGLLAAAGWETEVKSEYDAHYYRAWMHELPPMRHKERQTILDIHHTVLPPVARLTPNPQLFFGDAITTQFGPLMRPGAADMFVHAALHTFYDGDFSGCLRAFVDLRDLMDAGINEDADFVRTVITRAEAHDARRPVADALAMIKREASLPLQTEEKEWLEKQQRPAPIEALYQHCIEARALRPLPFVYDDPWLARFLLYVRSHWITMPPLMLGQHLTRKAVWRLRGGA